MISSYKDIQGWFDYESVYDKQIDMLKNGSTIVEVGCWLGKSSCYLAERIKKSGKKINLFCVDIWDYTDDDPYYNTFRELHPNLYQAFLSNVEELGFSKIIKPLQGNSSVVSQTFHDESIDFIFLDGNHHSPWIDEDIKLWFPKLKYGGCMAGHDFIDSSDVNRAVNDFFKKKVRSDGSCWIHYKMAL
jgi:predicted O-methyltransferase YrrM